MVNDETKVEEGAVEEEEDLLDFDLDDLGAEEESESGEGEEIIELVDLVEEDAEEAGGEPTDIEMLPQDDDSTPDTSPDEAVVADDDFDSILSDVDLDETEADIDMSDVALDLDLGLGEGEAQQAPETASGGDADLDSFLEEESGEAFSFDFEAGEDVPAGEESAAETQAGGDPGAAPVEVAEEEGISEDDLQKMLENESEEGFELDLSSEPGLDDTALDLTGGEAAASPGTESEEIFEDDITEEALERMLEDETESEEEPLEPASEEEVLVTTTEETVVESAPDASGVSEERIEEIVRGVVEEVVTREIRQSMSEVAERVIRESVTDAAERVIRETIEALRSSLETTGE